jgi:hypothetical protein
MPIIFKNEMADPNRRAQEQARLEEAAVARPIVMSEQPVVEESVNEQPEQPTSTNVGHHTVVIGGKEKKIAKNSAYLLDMITLEKE